MNVTAFIQVILPLKLEWEPYYELEGASVGDRVDLVFARRHYVGVVSAVNVTPEAGLKVLGAVPSELPPIGADEIAFWRRLADYYLCSVGEVYKVAYSMRQIESEKITRRRKKKEEMPSGATDFSLSPGQQEAIQAILRSFRSGKTVLLEDFSSRTEIYLELTRRVLNEGRNVLCLVPEIALSRQLETRFRACFPELLLFHSGCTVPARREVADVIRSGKPYVVLGTRSALFLPHRNLGLVIVHDEHDASYKQDSPAPRLHAREAAILLSLVHRSQVLLSSGTPSLESLYNVENGLFDRCNLNQDFGEDPLIVNIAAEARKNGMKGGFSIKLLEQIRQTLDAGEKVLLVCRAKAAQEESMAELKSFFPDAPEKLLQSATPASFKSLGETCFGLVAVHLADNLLGREDFRSDERTLQVLQQLQLRARRLVVQTREPGHHVFNALNDHKNALVFLEDRQAFSYPPVTRLIDICLEDKSPKRLDYMVRLLSRSIGSCLGPYTPYGREDSRVLRVTLRRDKSLLARKRRLAATVAAFEKEHRYIGHIHLDVDPQ
ncbi:MAG: hypothetical protein IK008_01210 [Bacteroidales bacterium]|nr:hypothetical protein [Bacteroidales bacterium]